jgi:hypothetical protein
MFGKLHIQFPTEAATKLIKTAGFKNMQWLKVPIYIQTRSFKNL